MNEQPLTFFRELPKKVTQYKSKEKGFTCWAAGLVSWLSVTPQSPGKWLAETQDDAIKNFGGKPFTTNEGNGILNGEIGLKWMTVAVGMTNKAFKPAESLSGEFLYHILRYKSHIYFGYLDAGTIPGRPSHCIVIYGITNASSKDCTISFMDPWIGDYLIGVPLRNYKSASIAAAGWLGYPIT